VSRRLLEQLTTALSSAFRRGALLKLADIPVTDQHYRSELGHPVYGRNEFNIPDEDDQRSMQADAANFRFYNGPTVIVVCIDK
jgi:hypothetical protein